MPKEASLTWEHYNTLTNMILAEQAQRQKLENVVRHLQEQLRTVLTASGGPYPPPGSDLKEQQTSTGGDFSSFEQDDSSDDDGRYEREDFRTPNEERAQFGDEIFGENLNTESKGAPRTLSLSAMTLGRGKGQPSVNF